MPAPTFYRQPRSNALPELPYMPLFIDRLMNNHVVAGMSWECRGVYFYMLMRAWQQKPCGTLPNHDAAICQIVGMAHSVWRRNKDILMRCFVAGDDGLIHQNVMEEIYAEVMEQYAARRDHAKKGATARWMARNRQADRPNVLDNDPGPLLRAHPNTSPVAPDYDQFRQQILNNLAGRENSNGHNSAPAGNTEASDAQDSAGRCPAAPNAGTSATPCAESEGG